jgi:hypothetical protein
MPEFYMNPHWSQYQAGLSTITRTSGCTWTTATNGADASTGGRVKRTPDQVHALLAKWEETNPSTPGWSIPDVDKAMARLGVGFEDRSGRGMAAVWHALDVEHLYVVLQGDSDVFENGTCAGAFDGDHCIGLHPHRNAVGQQRDDDPICLGVRYAGRSILERYAEKLSASVRFGVFTTPVPFIEIPRVVLSAPTPKEVNVALTYAQPGRHLELERGQPLYRHPGGPRVTAMSTRSAPPFVGSAGKGWAAVRVTTGGLYRDGKARPTVLYVPRAAGVLR